MWYQPTCGSATRYLVTLKKSGKIAELKKGLQKLVQTSCDDFEVAEVLGGHISRNLVRSFESIQ